LLYENRKLSPLLNTTLQKGRFGGFLKIKRLRRLILPTSHYYYGGGWRFWQAALFFLSPLLRQRVAVLPNCHRKNICGQTSPVTTYNTARGDFANGHGMKIFPYLLPTPHKKRKRPNIAAKQQKKNGQGRSLVRL